MEWLIGIGRNRLGGGTSSTRRSNTPDESSQKAAYLQDKYADRGQSLCHTTKEELQGTVAVPVGVDVNEWLATHTLSFFNHIQLLYAALSESCTAATCPNTNNFKWQETDSSGKPLSGKKISRMTAPQYIELVILHVQKYVTDDTVFATKYDTVFPTNFMQIVRKIFRLLFHVLVHIYREHYETCAELSLINSLDTLFVHFMLFQGEHQLLDPKEVAPLEDLVKSLSL